MMITMSRYNRRELEKAVDEKVQAGWECVGTGIVDLSQEKKMWNFEDGRCQRYGGRQNQSKFMVKMRKIDKPA